MMSVPGSTDWSDFHVIEQGAGESDITNGVLRTAVPIGQGGTGNRSIWQRYTHTSPGEIWVGSVYARRLSGADGSSGAVWFDWPSGGADYDWAEIRSPYWRLYTIRSVIPQHAEPGDTLHFGVGQYNGTEGVTEFACPRLSVANSAFGAPRSVGHALIGWDGSTAFLNVNFSRFNIKSVTYDGDNNQIVIASEPVPDAGAYMRPLMLAQMTFDGGSNAAPLVPKVGQYEAATGEWYVRFLDVTTGSYADISGIGTFYFTVFFFI